MPDHLLGVTMTGAIPGVTVPYVILSKMGERGNGGEMGDYEQGEMR